MLKSGVYSSEGKIYQLYFVEEKGYSRVDVMRPGSTFQVDYENVLFSSITKRNSYVYGDPAIYEEIVKFRESVDSMSKIPESTSEWVNGVYQTTITSTNPKLDLVTYVKLVNNDPVEMSIRVGNTTYSEEVMDSVYGLKIEPANFQDYEQITLSKDTIVTSGGKVYHDIEYLKRHHNISHVYKNDYVVATTEEVALQRLREWYTADVVVKGFDTETSGADVDIYGEDFMVGIILGETKTKATYFPFRHTSDDLGDDAVPNLSMDFLKILMECVIAEQGRCVAHNKKFDRKVMLKEGYDVRIKWCTLQLSRILNPVIQKGVHALKNLIYELNGKKYLELDDIFLSAADINFAILPLSIVLPYGCPDGSNVIELYEDQMSRLPKKQMKLAEIECALSDLKADQEYYGIRVDVQEYSRQYQNCNYILNELVTRFRQFTGEDGNISSSQVLSNLIYNKMRCEVLLRTKTGAPSTSTATIGKLAKKRRAVPIPPVPDIVDMQGDTVISGKDLADTQYPALLVLEKYKAYMKLKTSYYARFERTMKTGRVFFWVNQNGTLTGRQSSPMHQLPHALKLCMLADSTDSAFWGPDYSQVELRMLAYMAEETALIEMCKDPENDIHRVIGALLNNCEMWEITPEQRSIGKRRNFGAVYLISGQGLALQVKGPGYTQEDVDFCQKQLDEFFHGFKRVNRFIKRNAEKVKQRGYMETAWLHRQRLFEEVFDPDIEPSRMNSIIRMGNNMPIQGTSADLMKIAEVLMYDYIREKGWNELLEDGFPRVRPMLSIHDEIIISADKSIDMEEIVKMITVCMDIPVKDAPPFFAQPAYMENWGGHTKDELVMPIKLRDKLIADYEKTGVSVINYDNYIDVLETYRRSTLEDYMNDMMRKFGTDYKVLGAEIKHPSLTHALLDLYAKRIKELKKENSNITQRECIIEATRLYLEGASPVMEEVVSAQNDMNVQELTGEYESLVNYDEQGNIVSYEGDEEEDDIHSYTLEEDIVLDKESLRDFHEPIHCWELADIIVLDTGELISEGEINKAIAELYHFSCDTGFFKAYIIHKNKMVDLKFRIETIDLEHVNKFVNDLIRNRTTSSFRERMTYGNI